MAVPIVHVGPWALRPLRGTRQLQQLCTSAVGMVSLVCTPVLPLSTTMAAASTGKDLVTMLCVGHCNLLGAFGETAC